MVDRSEHWLLRSRRRKVVAWTRCRRWALQCSELMTSKLNYLNSCSLVSLFSFSFSLHASSIPTTLAAAADSAISNCVHSNAMVCSVRTNFISLGILFHYWDQLWFGTCAFFKTLLSSSVIHTPNSLHFPIDIGAVWIRISPRCLIPSMPLNLEHSG
jgi:hypothetical protein